MNTMEDIASADIVRKMLELNECWKKKKKTSTFRRYVEYKDKGWKALQEKSFKFATELNWIVQYYRLIHKFRDRLSFLNCECL